MSRNERSSCGSKAGLRHAATNSLAKPMNAHGARGRLGEAFVALIHEKPIDDVTVQDIVDRASVGRSTFYLHFRDFFDLAQTYFARGIKHRLGESKRLPKISPVELAARSSAMAGSLLSLLRWWLERGAKESPAEMDDLFHRMVWNGLR